MDVQTLVSGPISGQIPNQAGPQLPGVPQQIPPQMQSLGAPQHPTFNMEPDLYRARIFMQEKILEFLLHRHQQSIDESQRRKFRDIVKRLEEGLFKNAVTKEDYMNLATLETRLHSLIKSLPINNQNKPYQQVVSSSSTTGTMIPTPGMSHGGNSHMIVTSSMDNSMITITGSMAGDLLPTAGMQGASFNRSDGPVSNGYQQSPAGYSVSSGGNTSSMTGQRIVGQMIPTPGFNNSTCDIRNNNQSYMIIDSSNNAGGFPSIESTMVSLPQLQKQHANGQNNSILQNLGSQLGSGIRSGSQQKSSGYLNGAPNGGLGLMGNCTQLANASGASEGYLTAAPYASSPKPLQRHVDQHQKPLMQGDGYGMNNADSFQGGNFYGIATSVGSMKNAHDLNTVNFSSISKTRSSLISNQSNFQQAAHIKPQPIDQSEKTNFQSPLLDNSLHQQQSHQLQQHRHKLLNNHHNDSYGQIRLASNLGSHVKHEPGVEQCYEVHSQASQFQHSDTQGQLQQNSIEDCLRGPQHTSPSGWHDMPPKLSQGSQQIQQLLDSHHFVADSQNNFSSLSVGAQSESIMQGQWHPQPQDQNQRQGNMLHEQHVQEDFYQRISGYNEAHCNNLPSVGSKTGQTARRTAEFPNSSRANCWSVDNAREHDFWMQRRWLLFLFHARRCHAPKGECLAPDCVTVQELWQHIDKCSSPHCSFSRCHRTKELIRHLKNCRDPNCPVCVPSKNYIHQQRKRLEKQINNDTNLGLPGSSGSSKSYENASSLAELVSESPVENAEDIQPSLKRMKIRQLPNSLIQEGEGSIVSASVCKPYESQDDQLRDYRNGDIDVAVKSGFLKVKKEVHGNSEMELKSEVKEDKVNGNCSQRPVGETSSFDEPTHFVKQESTKGEKETEGMKLETFTQATEHAAETKSGKPNIKGVSLTELFTPEQIREHIAGLRRWVGQSKSKAEKNQAMEYSMSENSCQLCAVEKLTFEAPPIYCTPCGARIKRNAMYYTVGAGETRSYFCIPCHNEARGDAIVVDGTPIPKARLDKKKNDEETEEWWVQCDKCEAWQHQICALFNGRRNDGGQAEYTCPNCYVDEIKGGERKPLPQSAVLGAKDLPRTILSDHIEQRLFRRLKQERLERARLQEQRYDEVLGAEALVVRVVSSVDKKLEVKQRFLEIFQEENYPTEFPYKSKVILLFQKIEGVEVCLFGMYVQEFGSECQFPNQRRVYLSYLDSVKYFRPEIKAVTGEALRTFVYHEILIGYLEYCKKRGFTSCYIWACPPLKGEDYILYCHPEIQKTPKSDKLREWYLSMLRKATKENIVVGLTNLYEHFFVSTGECKAKVTASRLPYFDGDYWPGAAEDLIYQLRQEEDGRKQNKKGVIKKTITKRALKASGQSDLSGNTSKDLLLMHKLGETISPMKEDFIMVHLQHACTHCCVLMVSGKRWLCNQCKNFQLCDKCYEVEQKREERERHPINHREKHAFHPVEIMDVPVDTKDKDEILESEFFDNRQAFLSLCQGNHYQYDTLRRAKHSSMMVLFHLHNPTAPAFVTTCTICQKDIETGQGWRCEVCPDFEVCNSCYQQDGGVGHQHKLTNHPSIADRDAQNKEARQLRVSQLRKMLDLLVHAAQCHCSNCPYPNCRRVKGLFRHGQLCKKRASGGCPLCKRMWHLLQLHARDCKESKCIVPRCRDLKVHMRRLQQQSDSRRRAAVMEMMRQRAAEVTSNAE